MPLEVGVDSLDLGWKETRHSKKSKRDEISQMDVDEERQTEAFERRELAKVSKSTVYYYRPVKSYFPEGTSNTSAERAFSAFNSRHAITIRRTRIRNATVTNGEGRQSEAAWR